MDIIKEKTWKKWKEEDWNEESFNAKITNMASPKPEKPTQYTVKQMYETAVGWDNDEDPEEMGK